MQAACLLRRATGLAAVGGFLLLDDGPDRGGDQLERIHSFGGRNGNTASRYCRSSRGGSAARTAVERPGRDRDPDDEQEGDREIRHARARTSV
jgi:hypothetical protein